MIGRARLRLTAWYAAIFIATLGALGAAAYWSLARSLDDEVDRGVETVVQAWLGTNPSPASLRPIDLEREFEGETADVFLLVFRADGALVANPSGIEAGEFIERGLVGSALEGTSTWATVTDHGSRLRVLARPIPGERLEGPGVGAAERDEDGDDERFEPVEAAPGVAGVVIGGRSLAAHDRQLRLVLVVLGSVGAGGLLLGVLGGYWVSGRALRPIETAYEHQRRFVGDASHELRSPLAVIRASSELLLREPLEGEQRESVQEILDTSVEASDLVEELLALARLDAGTEARPVVPVAARTVIDGVVVQMAPLLEAHQTSVTAVGPAVEARADEADLRRALRALLENVLAHTPAGTPVDIRTSSEGGDVLIVVRDHGPGVPREALATLFDTFTRLDSARTPTSGHAGLGLAIARRLIARNEGALTALNHLEGGLEVTIRLKRA
ncbi:MAG: HAMP domain-containing sensor histidine kinase [Dehalococcoidia bacterium]